MRVVVCLFIGVLAVGSCRHDTPSAVAPPLADEPAPPLEGGPVVALPPIDAPGFATEALTITLRESLMWGSGVDVVDAIALRAEIAACVQLPCPETVQAKYREASMQASATLSRVGSSVLGALRITTGVTEVVRINAEGTDAAEVVTKLGRRGGAALRRAITSTPATTAP